MRKLVVFDLDGTLNRTDLFAVPAHQKALHESGVTDKTDDFIRSTFGSCSWDYVKQLLGDCDQDTARDYLDRVARYEQEFIRERGRTFDGVPQMLHTLREEGYLTAVCSNASARYINMVLRSLAIDPLIGEVQELRPGMSKNETLALLLGRMKPDAAVMVGDRRFDHEAAKANGLGFIGCLYGFNPQEMADADIQVGTASEIPGAVRALIGGAE